MRPAWAQRLPWDIITDQAQRLSMEPCLIAAVIMKESSGVTWKTRFEVHWKWENDLAGYASRLGISQATELIHQKTSWGLMQVMGATARDMGFRGYLVELCANPALGVHFGTKYLKARLMTTNTVEEALSTYNAGPGELKDGVINNTDYVASVMRFYRELTA